MARFKYLGEPPKPNFVKTWGNCLVIRVPRKSGGPVELTPVPPATKFVIGQDIGYEITDPISLLNFRNNTQRFQEIV